MRNFFSFFTSRNKMEGQMVLALVLIVVIGLAIGLSLISRTMVDFQMSTQIEQSSRAFSAAEAGVETALKNLQVAPTGTYSLDLFNSQATYKIEILGKSSDIFTFPLTPVGKTQTLWFVEHNDSGGLEEGSSYPLFSPLNVCWGNNAALVFTLFYKDADGEYKIAKNAYDPNPTASGYLNRSSNHFLVVSDTAGGYCGGGFDYQKTINAGGNFWEGLTLSPSAILLFLRIQPVYEETSIAINPSSSLPSQGKQIISMGKTADGFVRKIKVVQGYYALPEIFDFVFFSEN